MKLCAEICRSVADEDSSPPTERPAAAADAPTPGNLTRLEVQMAPPRPSCCCTAVLPTQTLPPQPVLLAPAVPRPARPEPILADHRRSRRPAPTLKPGTESPTSRHQNDDALMRCWQIAEYAI